MNTFVIKIYKNVHAFHHKNVTKANQGTQEMTNRLLRGYLIFINLSH